MRPRHQAAAIDAVSRQRITRYGTWALITGASSGIGYAFARHFCAAGINCVIVAEDGGLLDLARASIAEELPNVEVTALACDLADADAIERIASATAGLDLGVVVNCAGFGMMGYFIQHEWADYARMLRVNELAAIELTHLFCRRLYHRGQRGAIINVSTANAQLLRGCPFSAAYSAGKSMLQNLTEAISYEMKPHGIDVINVAPGPTNTGFQSVAGTKRLSWVETADNVVTRTLKNLGRKSTITTNPFSRSIIALHNWLPLPARLKTRMRAHFFRCVLGRSEQAKLPPREDRLSGGVAVMSSKGAW